MLMNTIFLSLFLSFFAGEPTDSPVVQNAGFNEALFDAGTIQDLLGRSGCDGIRFYNTLKDGRVEVMAVSISGGADMNGGLFPRKPYVVAKGVKNNEIEVEHVSEGDARDLCEAMHMSENMQYSADFSKSDFQTLFRDANTNAVRVQPRSTADGLSMQVEAVNFDRGQVNDVGQGEMYEMTSTDPCPPICGVRENYVFSPL